jgi:hypothetical protein
LPFAQTDENSVPFWMTLDTGIASEYCGDSEPVVWYDGFRLKFARAVAACENAPPPAGLTMISATEQAAGRRSLVEQSLRIRDAARGNTPKRAWHSWPSCRFPSHISKISK